MLVYEWMGEIDQTLLGSRVRFNVNSDLQLNSYIQYDTVSRNLGVNARIQWIFSPLGDVILVFNHNTAGGYWTNDAEANEFNVASPNITTNKYSILSKLDELTSNPTYEFRLHYPTLGITNHWSQTFDPRSGGSPSSPVPGYVAINIGTTNSFWGGLENSGGSTYLDGSVNHGNWWYSLGSINTYGGGIPGPGSVVPSVQLFIR